MQVSWNGHDHEDDDVVRTLLSHFDQYHRDLPWRRTSDPYAVWVSEVMLQQTRVDAVVPYYERWLERFPTVQVLSEAEPAEVLKAWEGLGYYARARNLHAAARVVRERHAGSLPADPADLKDLPGIGEYTAGAIASIAFGVPAPAVDGNTRRVLARLYDLEEPTMGQLRRRAKALVPEDRPGDFNQALMELGATVCTPRSPRCGACPLAAFCRAHSLGVQEDRPRTAAKRAVPERVIATGVVDDGAGRLLLVRRPPDGLLGGLWEFPGVQVAGEKDAMDAARRAAGNVITPAGDPAVSLVPRGAMEEVTQTFSHLRARYLPYRFTVEGGWTFSTPRDEEAEAVVWADRAALQALPLAKAQRRIARAVTPAGDR